MAPERFCASAGQRSFELGERCRVRAVPAGLDACHAVARHSSKVGHLLGSQSELDATGAQRSGKGQTRVSRAARNRAGSGNDLFVAIELVRNRVNQALGCIEMQASFNGMKIVNCYSKGLGELGAVEAKGFATALQRQAAFKIPGNDQLLCREGLVRTDTARV